MTTKRWTAWAAAAVVFCCAAGSLSAKGPIVFRVRAGLQTQGSIRRRAPIWESRTPDKDFGYQLGFLARFNLPILYIQPELMYTSHRFTMNLEGDASAKVSMKNLELPVMVGMKIAFLRVMAGPVFNLMNDTKNKLKKTSMAVTADITRPLVSYQLGAGIELGHIGFDVRYGGAVQAGRHDGGQGREPCLVGQTGHESVAVHAQLSVLTAAWRKSVFNDRWNA